MALELVEGDEDGHWAKDGLYPAAMVVADNDDTQWLESYPKSGAVRIPISEIEKAIEAAKRGVRSEAYFDRQRPNEPDGHKEGE